MKKTVLKILCTLLCLTAIFTSVFSVIGANAADGEKYYWGDVNADNKANSADARLVLRAVAKLDELTEMQRIIADVNRDGKVNTSDARQLLRVSAKIDVFRIEVKLGVGEKYVVDSIYGRGSYMWTVTSSAGLDVDEVIKELPPSDSIGEWAEQVYTFSAKTPGIYTANFKLHQIGDKSDIYEERVYTFIVQ